MLATATFFVLAFAIVQAPADRDSHGDGLPDFREVHQYFTDPARADSDGDGVPDGDWNERREFAYTVRTVLRVLRPCGGEELTDDYQDARVIASSDRYCELEVVHYPLNTCASAVLPRRNWLVDAKRLGDFLKPGVTTNWDAEMQRDLLGRLADAGIDPAALTDRDAAMRVAAWALRHADSHSHFNAFHVHYPGGVP